MIMNKMNKMNKLVFPRCVAALALASALAANAQDTIIVRIGQVGPTSGPAAHLGKDNVNGARLAIADLNARGLRIGGKPAHS